MSPKSMRTHRPSRSPSRRTGLALSVWSFSSTLSTMALTCRSLAAEAMTKTSVRASWSLTSMASTLLASLSSAAVAAALARSMACCVAATRVLLRLGVQVVLVDVLRDAVGHEVPDGLAPFDAGAAVGGADRHGRDLLEGDPVAGQPVVRQLMAGTGDPDEVGELEQLVGVLPRQDLGQRVGAGDEEQLGVGPFAAQVAQGVDRVGGTGAVDVDPAHREAGVGGGGDDGHEVAVLGRADLALVLLPRLTGGHEDDLIEPEPGLDFGGGHQVAVVDRVE